jgi:hypothetical protein
MSELERSEALSRLKVRYEDTGAMLAKALAPLDEAIRAIDVPFRASHYAEDCQDWQPPEGGPQQAHASRFVFALESVGGVTTEYSLCAARGEDGACGLYVSICESRDEATPPAEPDGQPVHRVVIDRIYVTKPETLSLWLRAQIMDELSQGHFLRAYREYVEQTPDPPAEGGLNRYWLPSRD